MLAVDRVDARVIDVNVLGVDERRRHRTLQRPEDRLGYLAAHLLLRELVGVRLGIGPAEVELVRQPCPHCGGPHGRPEIAGGTVSFSLSRSVSTVGVAVAEAPIGVDIEGIADEATVRSVSRLLAPVEQAAIEAAPAAAQPSVFTRSGRARRRT